MTTANILDIQRLTKRRQSEAGLFEVLVDRLVVKAGSFVVLAGASGSGKSTLLDIFGLVLRPSFADCFLFHGDDDEAVDVLDAWDNDEQALAELRRRCLGYVLQTGGLLPFMSVAGNIELAANLSGQRIERTEIEVALTAIGLAGQAQKMPAQLSGGERQRTAILRALMQRPKLILADEPTAAVDRRRAKSIMAMFCERARQDNTAIVLVTHDAGLVDGLADSAFELIPDDTHNEPSLTRYHLVETKT